MTATAPTTTVEKSGGVTARTTMGGAVQVAQVFSLPLVGGEIATVQLPRGMSEESWAHLLSFLGVLKPGLVRRDSATDDTNN